MSKKAKRKGKKTNKDKVCSELREASLSIKWLNWLILTTRCLIRQLDSTNLGIFHANIGKEHSKAFKLSLTR